MCYVTLAMASLYAIYEKKDVQYVLECDKVAVKRHKSEVIFFCYFCDLMEKSGEDLSVCVPLSKERGRKKQNCYI